MIEYCPMGNETSAVHQHCKGCGCCLTGGSVTVLSDGPYCCDECRAAFHARNSVPPRPAPPARDYFVFPPVQPIQTWPPSYGGMFEVTCSTARNFA